MKTQNKLITRVTVAIFAMITLACNKDDLAGEVIAQDVCKTDPCGNPANCPDSCPSSVAPEGSLTEENFTTEGNREETENGFKIDGKLNMETESGEMISFVDTDAELEFNEDGSLKNMSGTVEIPSPSNYFEFEDPIQADIGFFSGKWLNENRNFEIKLKDERSYFIYNISVSFELKIGANDDPDATKPVSISPPVGGYITLIADYDDPMFFYSFGGDAFSDSGDGNNGDGSNNNDDGEEVLGVSFGASANAYLEYVPTLPVENVVSFDAKQVTGGKFSFWKVLEASGMYYQNKGFSVDFNLKEPMESEIGYGYRAGINGNVSFSADIKDIVSFGFPIGKGSTAIVAEASSKDGLKAKAFVNGLVEPDLSWWPEFIPVSPSGNLNAYGYVEQTGAFDLGLSGYLGLETPSGTQSLEGALRLTHEAFTMQGAVTIDDEVWGAKATFTKEETRCVSAPPKSFTEGISETVTEQIDAAITTTEQAYEDLEKANEQYELELSLRGLRAALPGIMDSALDEVNAAEAAGIKSGRDQANKILGENGMALCSDNISSVVKSVTKPYKDALTRLRNSVNETNDNEQTRTELEAALRQLAGLGSINKNASVRITHGNKKTLFVPACTIKSTVTRTVKIKGTILNPAQIAKLKEAADNVKYIKEADGIRFDAQIILDQLPTLEELEELKSNVEACVNELTQGIGDIGFILNHESGEFSFFIVINGEEKVVEGFDIFSSSQIIETARLETFGCNPNEALKQLLEKSKR